MPYKPRYTISPQLVKAIEEIATYREKIVHATIQVSWIPSLQKETRVRNTHSSTAIEGNPLTLKEVGLIEEGKDIGSATDRSKKEIIHYLAGLKFIEKHSLKTTILIEDVLKLHSIMAKDVMDQGKPGQFRTFGVQVGTFLPPAFRQVPKLMRQLIDWWNKESTSLSPVISSAILHYRFEAIHPFADGNGRVGRTLALWELYRRGFDSHHIFSIDDFYWEDRGRYYKELQTVQKNEGNLTSWLEYSAEAILNTLQAVWMRIQKISASSHAKKMVLKPKQELLLQLLRDQTSLSPREVWDALDISKQGAQDLIKPLVEVKLIEKVGTKKNGKYILKK